MQDFINRINELRFLNDEYNRNGSSLVILYGRRRIGKTALISEFGKDKAMLYFLVSEEAESQNRTIFKDLVAEYTKNDLLKASSVDNWDIIFKTLVGYKTEQKKLIVIDEFQYLGKSNKAFPSVFQRIWDTILKNENVMVILCGSLISMMEAQTLTYGSPLYGRRTGQIRLKQIPFKHYNEFFPHKSLKELVEFYSVTGGVPKYIELFYDSEDVFKAIYNNILKKQSFLYEEPHFLLQNEVTEVGSYFSVIKTIAQGNRKLSKIANNIGLPQTGLTKYLGTLINLDILEREVPVTEENPEKSKRGLYKIKDNFICFWFRFIYPNLSFLETDNDELVMNKIKANFIDNHVSFIYEDVCLERLWQLNSEGVFGFNFDRAGRWWNNDTEIDIVAYDSTGNDMIFCECKYTEKPMDVDVFYVLEEKAKKVEWKRNSRIEKYCLFSINGFTENLQELSKSRKDIKLVT